MTAWEPIIHPSPTTACAPMTQYGPRNTSAPIVASGCTSAVGWRSPHCVKREAFLSKYLSSSAMPIEILRTEKQHVSQFGGATNEPANCEERIMMAGCR